MTVSGDASISLEPAWPLHVEYGLDFGFGAARGEVPMHGFGGLFALDINVFALDWLGIGGTMQVTLSADPAADDPATMEVKDETETPNYEGWTFGGGPRIRIYDDDVPHGSFSHREGWVIDLDGGWLIVDEVPGKPGPFGRLTLGRQIFLVNHNGNGVNLGLGVAIESGFADASKHRAVLTSFWFHGEGGAAVASTKESPERDPWLPTTFAVDFASFLGKNFGSVGTNGVIGMSASYGIGASELVEPLIRADVLSLRKDGGDATTMLGATGGLRFRFNRWAPWQTELLGGYEHAYGVTPLRIASGPVVDLGTGLHIVHCKYGIDIGARLRLGVGDDNDKLHTLALILGFVRGNQEGAPGRPRNRCDGGVNR
jgi:hypothetical protein